MKNDIRIKLTTRLSEKQYSKLRVKLAKEGKKWQTISEEFVESYLASWVYPKTTPQTPKMASNSREKR
jgi:hypothetical protein